MFLLRKIIFIRYRWLLFFKKRNNYFYFFRKPKLLHMYKYYRNLNYFFFKFFKKKRVFLFLKKKYYLSFFLKKLNLLKISKKNYKVYQFYKFFPTLKFSRFLSLVNVLKFFFFNLNFFFINFFFINFFFINFFFINGLKYFFYFNLILSSRFIFQFSITPTTLKYLLFFFILKRKLTRFIRKRNSKLFKLRKLQKRQKLKLHNKYLIFFYIKISQYCSWEINYLSLTAFILPISFIKRLYSFIPINLFYRNIYFWQKKLFY